MDNLILNSYSKISNLNVSRETCNELESFISMIQKKNKEINIISRKNSDQGVIRQRHIVDSVQIIDFVDLNSNTTYDLGSGGGMPGLIIAILMKKLKNSMKIKLYEKSHHKCVFLKDVSDKLNSSIYSGIISSCFAHFFKSFLCRGETSPNPTFLSLLINLIIQPDFVW